MRTNVTAKIKIIATPEIIRTFKVYGKGLQFCINYAWKLKIKNNIQLHPFVYKRLRKTLPSQLAIACIKQACGIVKKAKTKPFINRVSMRYNFPRSASFKDNVLSLSTIKGRVKIPFSIPSCYQRYFTWGQPKESLLRIDKKNRCFFLFTFSKEVNAIKRNIRSQNFVLGVDLGVKRLAVLSDGEHIHGRNIRGVKRRYDFLRRKLQAKGTHSAIRLLKKVRGREKRFVAWANHNVSKRIVEGFTGGVIRLEDLEGIKKQRGRRHNKMLGCWSYYQLQSFISYKAAIRG
ncbi:transposase, partial [Candidatus Woesearchaeota archaeon]|nr:transposase [Candidatus Woesearchaeota archaeon]